jgi:hypothetical protein
VSRLDEFALAAAGMDPAADFGSTPWRLSALIGKDLDGELSAVAEFNRDVSKPWARRYVIDAVEIKAGRAEDIPAARKKTPPSIKAYFEIPIQEDPSPLISAILAAGASAKVRTGGVTPEMIPEPSVLARFISACARAGAPFKATAGLHHPLRSMRPLTYAPDSPRAMMHGFLNVFLAAAFAADGMDREAPTDLLREEEARAFTFGADEIVWRGHRLATPRLLSARQGFAIAFGSCSFAEPKEDLKEACLL